MDMAITFSGTVAVYPPKHFESRERSLRQILRLPAKVSREYNLPNGYHVKETHNSKKGHYKFDIKAINPPPGLGRLIIYFTTPALNKYDQKVITKTKFYNDKTTAFFNSLSFSDQLEKRQQQLVSLIDGIKMIFKNWRF